MLCVSFAYLLRTFEFSLRTFCVTFAYLLHSVCVPSRSVCVPFAFLLCTLAFRLGTFCVPFACFLCSVCIPFAHHLRIFVFHLRPQRVEVERVQTSRLQKLIRSSKHSLHLLLEGSRTKVGAFGQALFSLSACREPRVYVKNLWVARDGASGCHT